MSVTTYVSQRRPPLRQRGVTLIEMVMAIVVAGLVLGGMMSAWNHLVLRSADPVLDRQRLVLARGLMEDVLSRPVSDPSTGRLCPPPPALRRDFDNVCDFNGWQAADGEDAGGQVYPALQGYPQRVTVTPQAWGDIAAGRALRITVVVGDPAGGSVQLEAWRTCAGGANDCRP